MKNKEYVSFIKMIEYIENIQKDLLLNNLKMMKKQ